MNKKATIKFRLTESEKQQIILLAFESNQSVADLIRRAILGNRTISPSAQIKHAENREMRLQVIHLANSCNKICNWLDRQNQDNESSFKDLRMYRVLLGKKIDELLRT